MPTEVRLAIVLRHLAAGDTYPALAASFRVSVPAICKMVKDTVRAINEEYGDLMHLPQTQDEWLAVADRFQLR